MAVHEHFAPKQRMEDMFKNPDQNPDITETADEKGPGSSAMPIAEEDLWTLEYITVQRVQPLIEAMDDDASSFVTINEINVFSRARPKDWR